MTPTVERTAPPTQPSIAASSPGARGSCASATARSALAENDRTARRGLQALVTRAAAEGRLPAGLSPDQVATWVVLLVDGFYSRILSDPGFDIAREAAVLGRLVDGLTH